VSRSEQRVDAVGMMRSHGDRTSAEIEGTTPEAQKAWMARRTVEDPLLKRPEGTAGGEQTFWAGVEEAGRFFMGEADVQRAMERLARKLDELGIPYAVIGAMALNEWGYRRVTVDVDVLLTPEGLSRLKGEVVGRGYVERTPGGRGLRDTVAEVDVDFVLTGEYPGDGRPKPVAFPDPRAVAVRGERVALLPLAKLIELKLASGISAPHRLRDLADVLELIRILSLPRETAESLDPSVRAKFDELWQAAQAATDESPPTP
jgi:hypothetical protein